MQNADPTYTDLTSYLIRFLAFELTGQATTATASGVIGACVVVINQRGTGLEEQKQRLLVRGPTV